jgi:protein-disulfide isomerase
LRSGRVFFILFGLRLLAKPSQGRNHLMSTRAVVQGIFAVLVAAIPCVAQVAPAPAKASASTDVRSDQSHLLKASEAFVRELFAWGPNVQVKLGPLSPSAAADFYMVPIEVTLNHQTESGDVYVSKDGKTLLRGEIYDMSADPFAANRAKIHIDGNPSKGPANARVTVVEFSDFECPHCQELYEALKTIEARYPQVLIVHKDFPLNRIHAWAETAAIGARCAFEQSPAAFWKVHDSIFDNQDLISAENAWEKIVGYAVDAGVNADTFKACLASPGAKKAVAADRAEGVALGVNSTPTVYINGRPLIGGDTATLEQYIDYELAKRPK